MLLPPYKNKIKCTKRTCWDFFHCRVSRQQQQQKGRFNAMCTAAGLPFTTRRSTITFLKRFSHQLSRIITLKPSVKSKYSELDNHGQNWNKKKGDLASFSPWVMLVSPCHQPHWPKPKKVLLPLMSMTFYSLPSSQCLPVVDNYDHVSVKRWRVCWPDGPQ